MSRAGLCHNGWAPAPCARGRRRGRFVKKDGHSLVRFVNLGGQGARYPERPLHHVRGRALAPWMCLLFSCSFLASLAALRPGLLAHRLPARRPGCPPPPATLLPQVALPGRLSSRWRLRRPSAMACAASPRVPGRCGRRGAQCIAGCVLERLRRGRRHGQDGQPRARDMVFPAERRRGAAGRRLCLMARRQPAPQSSSRPTCGPSCCRCESAPWQATPPWWPGPSARSGSGSRGVGGGCRSTSKCVEPGRDLDYNSQQSRSQDLALHEAEDGSQSSVGNVNPRERSVIISSWKPRLETDFET